jgi:branched-chain amino acid aminotransferase
MGFDMEATATAIRFDRRPATTPAPREERERRLANPGFGKVFTDNMIVARWTAGAGWHDGALVPYGPLVLDPATIVLHYGQSIFEGLKAFLQPDGSVAIFRPAVNAARMRRSAHRLALPELPEAAFIEACEILVRQDVAWVPTTPGHSLYLRPLLFGVEAGLGVRAAREAQFVLIASPASSYFPGDVEAVSVWLCDDYVRAAPGGTGDVKCAGNYAASLLAQDEAMAHGCAQVIWLDALERRWVEEMGGMNIFFVYPAGGRVRIVTPALTGTLLSGVTRDSLLTIAADLGFEVEEGRISADEWQQACRDGRMTEAFACGTAAVLSPIGLVRSKDAEWTVGDGEPGPVSLALRRALLDVQQGLGPDPHGWRHPVPV